jgi:hypothetical protein
LVVGTWNLENLFRPSGDAGPRDEPSYEAKLAELARVIGAIDPDVLAVQEVGDPTRSRTCAGASAAGFPDGRGIRVGFLSRLEFTGV